MALSAGMRLGPYEIEAPLGAGGMGEVYRARDQRLGRIVAIKVLAPGASASPTGQERFEREAKAISSLSHSNICALFDVGRENGAAYLVMEHLEGETLAARLLRGPLPMGPLVEIAIQIASALEHAHRHRLVHRDLKPGNVMLTRSGAKLLDFGLARPLAPASPLSTDETASRALTQPGRLVGTFPYMAPELLQGKEGDARSDLFALGAVVYEMATGSRAFEGESQIAVAASILEKEPAALASLRPELLRRVVSGCLEKDPAARWQSAGDAARVLGWTREQAVVAAHVDSKPARPRWPLALAGVAAAFALGTLAGRALKTPSPREARPMHRSSLLPPAEHALPRLGLALSADGARLAFVAIAPDGLSRLWVRSLATGAAQALEGTLNAATPFWAPDGRRVGFFADGKLKVVDTDSGAVQALAEAPWSWGGSWAGDGTILYSPTRGPVYAIPDRGGEPRQVTPFDAAVDRCHVWPRVLPDGRTFLFGRMILKPESGAREGVYAGSLDGAAPRLVSAELPLGARFASGHLLFVRAGSLMAQPFDAATLRASGAAVTLVDEELDGYFGLAASDSGSLVFQSLVEAPTELIWHDRGGRVVGRLAEAGFRNPQLSPDGRRLAVSDDGRDGKSFIRVLDLERGVATPLTDGGSDYYPAWAPDGRRLAYMSAAGPRAGIVEMPADGSGQGTLLIEGHRMLPTQYSPDGRGLLYMRYDGLVDEVAFFDAARRASVDIVMGAEGQLSPDGKWLAYNSTPRERRQPHVYVQPFPGPGPQVQISRAGGAQPRWSADGRRLYFVAPDRKLMEAEIGVVEGRLAPGAPRALFQTRIVATEFSYYEYDVTRDGSRFLVHSLRPDAPLTLLTDWPSLLRR